MYSREEIKALTDKVLNMASTASAAKADGVEVSFDGGERAGTRWANSTITTNLVQYDQQISINIRLGAKAGTSSAREFDDESLKAAVDEAIDAATYNAITTDFWANLDAIGSQESWRMFGTGGDAKGQPTQTNSISHGSPTIRIKKIMVGAAYA